MSRRFGEKEKHLKDILTLRYPPGYPLFGVTSLVSHLILLLMKYVQYTCLAEGLSDHHRFSNIEFVV